MGVLEDWPRPRGQNFVALALASKTPGLGLGLDHVVLEHIPGSTGAEDGKTELNRINIALTSGATNY